MIKSEINERRNTKTIEKKKIKPKDNYLKRQNKVINFWKD